MSVPTLKEALGQHVTYLGPCEDISILQHDRDGLLLDGRGFLKTLFKYTHQQLPLEEEVLEVSSLGLSDIFRLVPSVLLWRDEPIFVCARA